MLARRNLHINGGQSVVEDKMRGAFPGSCRMFVDFPSSGLAQRELHVISSFLLEQFEDRKIRPVASIRGAHGSTSSSVVGKSKTVKDQDCCKAFCVWVGNLPRLVDVKEIHALFAECGRIHGITRHQGDGRTSAFVKFETWASACSAMAAVFRGMLCEDRKLKCDAGFDLSYVLDLVIELRTSSHQRITYLDALRIARAQDFEQTNWRDVVARVDCLQMCNTKQTIEFCRDLGPDEILAVRSRLKTKGKKTSDTSDIRPDAAQADIVKALEEDADRLCQLLRGQTPPSCVHSATAPRHDASTLESELPVVVGLVEAYGADGVDGAELAGLLTHTLSTDVDIARLKTYLQNLPHEFCVQDTTVAGAFRVFGGKKAAKADDSIPSPAFGPLTSSDVGTLPSQDAERSGLSVERIAEPQLAEEDKEDYLKIMCELGRTVQQQHSAIEQAQVPESFMCPISFKVPQEAAWRKENLPLVSYNLPSSFCTFHPSSPPTTNATNTVMHMEKYFRDALGNGNSGDMPTTTSVPLGVHAEKSLKEWTVENVFDLFYACGFETHGVVMGRVDGPTLYYLFTDPESRYLLTAPAPEGLGLTPLQVSARLTCEMNRLMCNL